jgi:hypothetical protein
MSAMTKNSPSRRTGIKIVVAASALTASLLSGCGAGSDSGSDLRKAQWIEMIDEMTASPVCVFWIPGVRSAYPVISVGRIDDHRMWSSNVELAVPTPNGAAQIVAVSDDSGMFTKRLSITGLVRMPELDDQCEFMFNPTGATAVGE